MTEDWIKNAFEKIEDDTREFDEVRNDYYTLTPTVLNAVSEIEGAENYMELIKLISSNNLTEILQGMTYAFFITGYKLAREKYKP